MPAGYSKTPLIKKLGIKPGMRVLIENAPAHYPELLGPLPEGVDVHADPAPGTDFIHAFTNERNHLEQLVPMLKPHLAANGMLWISWPKKASKMPSEINENDVREVGLNNGLVDVKVCAVDEDWSGLKFVYRVHERLQIAD